MPTCARISATTTAKYLRVAFIDGVAFSLNSGSSLGGFGSASSGCAAWKNTMPAMAPIMTMMLATDQMPAPAVGVLPTRGSCGQLLVYDRPVSPGRSVAAAQDDQKKKPVSAVRSSAAGREPALIAYCSRSLSSFGSVPNRPA